MAAVFHVSLMRGLPALLQRLCASIAGRLEEWLQAMDNESQMRQSHQGISSALDKGAGLGY